MELSSLSLTQLIELQQKIPAEIKRRQAQEKTAVLNELKAMAQKRGFSLDDLLGTGGKTRGPKTGGKVAVKYRHPKDTALQWTGRGRQPKWVAAWLASGGKLGDLTV